MRDNKKGQIGLVTSLVMAIAGLTIGVIIAFVIVSTLSDADLLTAGRTSETVINESGWINSTTYTLGVVSNSTFVEGTISITSVLNHTSQTAFPAANYSISDAGVVTNLTAEYSNDVGFNYTYTIKASEETATEHLSSNFTRGVDNVSSKLPTVLLIAAVVLILTILALLVAVWSNMGIGRGGGGI